MGFNRVMTALNFTCSTNITRITVGAKRVLGVSWPLIDIWGSQPPRTDAYARISGITLTNASATPSPGVYEYILPETFPVNSNNIISLYEPIDSLLDVYSEKDSGMHPPSVYLHGLNGEVDQEQLSDDDRPLLSIDTSQYVVPTIASVLTHVAIGLK